MSYNIYFDCKYTHLLWNCQIGGEKNGLISLLCLNVYDRFLMKSDNRKKQSFAPQQKKATMVKLIKRYNVMAIRQNNAHDKKLFGVGIFICRIIIWVKKKLTIDTKKLRDAPFQ